MLFTTTMFFSVKRFDYLVGFSERVGGVFGIFLGDLGDELGTLFEGFSGYFGKFVGKMAYTTCLEENIR